MKLNTTKSAKDTDGEAATRFRVTWRICWCLFGALVASLILLVPQTRAEAMPAPPDGGTSAKPSPAAKPVAKPVVAKAPKPVARPAPTTKPVPQKAQEALAAPAPTTKPVAHDDSRIVEQPAPQPVPVAHDDSRIVEQPAPQPVPVAPPATKPPVTNTPASTPVTAPRQAVLADQAEQDRNPVPVRTAPPRTQTAHAGRGNAPNLDNPIDRFCGREPQQYVPPCTTWNHSEVVSTALSGGAVVAYAFCPTVVGCAVGGALSATSAGVTGVTAAKVCYRYGIRAEPCDEAVGDFALSVIGVKLARDMAINGKHAFEAAKWGSQRAWGIGSEWGVKVIGYVAGHGTPDTPPVVCSCWSSGSLA